VPPTREERAARGPRPAPLERAVPVAGPPAGPARPVAWPARSAEAREPERHAAREEVPGAPARPVAPALRSARQ